MGDGRLSCQAEKWRRDTAREICLTIFDSYGMNFFFWYRKWLNVSFSVKLNLYPSECLYREHLHLFLVIEDRKEIRLLRVSEAAG